MNRDFLIRDLTPAVARKIKKAMSAAMTYVDPKILEMAEQDLVDDAPADIRPIVQFIKDYNLRCILPYESSAEKIREAIAFCLPSDRRVIFIDEAIHWNRRIGSRLTAYKEDSGEQYQFISKIAGHMKSLINDRDAIIVAKSNMESGYYYPWIGKCFNEVILYCEYENQYDLFNKQNASNSVVIAAKILNPTLANMNLQTKPMEKTFPLMGAYDGMLRNKNTEKVANS